VAPDAGRQRFSDFATEWAEAQDWAPTSRESAASVIRRIVRYLGPATRLDQVDALRLSRLRNDLVRDYAHGTAVLTLHYATTIMRAAASLKRVPADVTTNVRPPKARHGEDEPVGPEDVPTGEEIIAILKATRPEYRAIVALGTCGLRISEALGVTVGQLDLDQRLLTVDRQLIRIDGRPVFKLPKCEKPRGPIELSSLASFELRRHLRDHGPFWTMADAGPTWRKPLTDADALLFRGGREAPLRRDQFYASAWKPALVAAGLDEDRYVFHSLRHWCASTMLAHGCPVTQVAGHLGDTPETVLRTYAHWLRDDREGLGGVLDRALAPTLEGTPAVARVTPV
jgi:integrase